MRLILATTALLAAWLALQLTRGANRLADFSDALRTMARERA